MSPLFNGSFNTWWFFTHPVVYGFCGNFQCFTGFVSEFFLFGFVGVKPLLSPGLVLLCPGTLGPLFWSKAEFKIVLLLFDKNSAKNVLPWEH